MTQHSTPREHPAATMRRDALTAAYKAVGGLHPRPYGSPWCEAGNCWGRVKTAANRAVGGFVQFGPKEYDGGLWMLCETHRRIIEPTNA